MTLMRDEYINVPVGYLTELVFTQNNPDKGQVDQSIPMFSVCSQMWKTHHFNWLQTKDSPQIVIYSFFVLKWFSYCSTIKWKHSTEYRLDHFSIVTRKLESFGGHNDWPSHQFLLHSIFMKKQILAVLLHSSSNIFVCLLVEAGTSYSVITKATARYPQWAQKQTCLKLGERVCMDRFCLAAAAWIK